jgi:hypothetical protein
MKPVVPAARLIDLNDAFVFSEDSWIFDSSGVGVLGMKEGDFPMPLVSTPKQQSKDELEAAWKAM